MIHAPAHCCDACLRRGMLLGVLAPRIQAVLDTRERRPSGVLALGDRELIGAVGGDAVGANAFLEGFEPEAARAAVEQAGLTAVCRHADAYPRSLFDLTDPPAVLFGAGRVEPALAALRDERSVAVVGSRKASTYGLEMARTLGRELGAAGLPVVSGLALGVDAAAHEGALAGGGLCVAVLGGGADVPYPHTNRGVYDRVRERGAILSEMPPGQRPFRWGFPARNRIMAALTHATLVVEAAHRSGSLITTEYAAEIGRVVAAVPGQATNRGARGSNDLLRHGAPLVEGGRDLLDELFGAGNGPAIRPEVRATPGDPLAVTVLEGVEKGWGLDRLCAETGAPVGEVRGALSRLEAARLVSRDGLGAYYATGVGAM